MGGYKNIPKIEALKLDDKQHLKKMCEYYINEFCNEYKIEDITKISEVRFKAALDYIYSNYFRLSKYTDRRRAPAIDSVIDYTDIAQLLALLESYLYLCAICDKIPSRSGFAIYTGINETTFNSWENEYNNNDIYNSDITENSEIDIYKSLSIYDGINNSNTINNINNILDNDDYINTIKSVNDKSIYKSHLVFIRHLILKTIINSNENALADRLASGGAQAVGIIAVLNHRHGWANSAPSINITAPKISLSDLPTLTDNTQND